MSGHLRKTSTLAPSPPTGKSVSVWIMMKSINGCGSLIKTCSSPGKWHLWSKWMRSNWCPQLSNLKLNREKSISKRKLFHNSRSSLTAHYSHPILSSQPAHWIIITMASFTHSAWWLTPGKAWCPSPGPTAGHSVQCPQCAHSRLHSPPLRAPVHAARTLRQTGLPPAAPEQVSTAGWW